MTRIRATCPVCGEVELTTRDVNVRVLTDDVGDVLDGSIYRFRCPSCETMVTKSADERIVQLLETGGVAITRTCMDAVADNPSMIGVGLPTHPEGVVSGPVLTVNDLIDFHELLAGTAWFEELSSLVS